MDENALTPEEQLPEEQPQEVSIQETPEAAPDDLISQEGPLVAEEGESLSEQIGGSQPEDSSPQPSSSQLLSQESLVVVDPTIYQTQEVKQPTRLSKRAFQNRFPKLSNGISTKYDALSMFLKDIDYAKSLGLEGEALFSLRLLINTGVNRMEASAFVDYSVNEAEEFLTLLMQPFVPEVFRITIEEKKEILSLPLKPEEVYRPENV